MNRLLIANRGEIAVRILRACREHGVSPVGVYSEADRDAAHVALCDAALCIGPGPAAESYLRVDALVEAARRLGADAVHPGYGFLSENAAFAQACAEAGLTFVGPPASVIRTLGDKIAAKQLMAGAGVPVVPGYRGEDQGDARLRAEAEVVGTPLLLKAAAGGGGRGMRRVDDLAEFPARLDEARREAQAAFGDARVLLERYVERPHHVEVQIFGDTCGNVVHLFERECSIQRRHQKIVEESPSPALTSALRERITAAAVTAGRAAGYVGAGTVEFLVDGDAFYFLEVNTRLQVEHPVTEMVTGLDLVRWQLLVADGHPLPLSQEEISTRGHAIEVRVYAEDPATGFLPSVGTIAAWDAPSGPGVRVDSGYGAGDAVPPFYDPMLAKLIVYAASREAATARLRRALREFTVLGVRTNVPYLLAIAEHPAFAAGETTTAFLGEHFAGWRPDEAVPEEVLLALAADSALPGAEGGADGAARDRRRRPGSAWQTADGWRNTK
ncbi:MAG TPA: acetyl-CoA carboxylase biotin carboxylase subunit [Armatimonadaceae bacterium]|nr:acetyl-CoA carboxylase biotin carboxylase subunit [Armatimonadaceae bacterium]